MKSDLTYPSVTSPSSTAYFSQFLVAQIPALIDGIACSIFRVSQGDEKYVYCEATTGLNDIARDKLIEKDKLADARYFIAEAVSKNKLNKSL
jgi:hypothetical protein